MNKLIEKLSEQADRYARSDNSSMLFENYRKRYSEKLAELIVRECAKVAWYHTPDYEELEYSHLIKNEILKRFGIEE